MRAGFYRMRCGSCDLEVRFSHGTAFMFAHFALIALFLIVGTITKWANDNQLVASLVIAMVLTEVIFWWFPGAVPAAAAEQ
ncbi:MAG: hypothetical protein OEW90_07540 [Betaproteobacteria bacterium]|nr:hypothetical protein [Betaproteobacteria bacterium]